MDRINEVLAAYKYPALICLVGIVLVFFGSSSAMSTSPHYESVKKDLPPESLVKAESLGIKADISGAVKNPGVYALDKDARVEDLISIAGGFDASASAEYVAKNINLSQKITDAQKIYIPYKAELDKGVPVKSLNVPIPAQTVPAQSGITTTSGKVSINNASQSELESLPGIGPVTAAKIITNRPYSDPNELISKKAVGKATFEKIKDLIEL